MTCFLLRKPRVLPVLWQLHSGVQRNAAHCPQSQVSGVDHSLTCDSRDVVSSTETTTEASHSSVCLSCERLQTPPETFTDHCHTNRVTCWQHSETHSWRNNCKLLQNESCCTWRCLWYKCLQTWTVSRCCSAPVPVSAHRTSLASYLHSCRRCKGLKNEPTAPLTDREQEENCKCANRNGTKP